MSDKKNNNRLKSTFSNCCMTSVQWCEVFIVNICGVFFRFLKTILYVVCCFMFVDVVFLFFLNMIWTIIGELVSLFCRSCSSWLHWLFRLRVITRGCRITAKSSLLASICLSKSSVTLKPGFGPWLGFQGRDIFWHWISPKRHEIEP